MALKLLELAPNLAALVASVGGTALGTAVFVHHVRRTNKLDQLAAEALAAAKLAAKKKKAGEWGAFGHSQLPCWRQRA